ncbi:V-type ATPase 116kDa subunit family protein [Halochromatium sp.]
MLRLRPIQACWFETYVPREQSLLATDLLASSGAVQLELDPRVPERVDTRKLHSYILRFRALAEAYREDLPSSQSKPTALVGNPLHLTSLALQQLQVWAKRLDYLHEHLDQLQAELDYLELLDEGLATLQAAGLDLDGLNQHSHFLCKCLFACPQDNSDREPALQALVHRVVRGSKHDFALLLGEPEDSDMVRRMVLEQGCEPVGIPNWLSTDHSQQGRDIDSLRRHKRARIDQIDSELAQLRADPKVAVAHANLETLAWYLEHAAHQLGSHDLCHITGWTIAPDPTQLQHRLRDADIRAIMRFPEPPPSVSSPVMTLDTWWAQPFRPLLLMWGTPGHAEVDPSGVLALIVPLLFGYMFPDVGHGLMLAAFAMLFWQRWPAIRFLLPCGLSAVFFGLLFGDIFGFEDLIPALWLKPLEAPMMVLGVPMLFGVLLLLLGLVFAGLEAQWRGRLRQWLQVEAAVLLLYLLLLLAPFVHDILWLVPLALLHYLVGSAMQASERLLATLGAALGQLLLSLFELALNTLSFLRVGAFALAHAALSHAIMALADTVQHPVGWLLILVLGNLFAVVLEGLIVFVQTTRLVLFEFFIRFLQADGRIYQPLHQPPNSH